MNNPLPHRFSLLLCASTLGLIVAGGLVTSTQSGLAVPDWPLSYGRVLVPMKGAILFEHGHRAVAASVGLLAIVTALVFRWTEPRGWLRGAAWGAVGLVVVQGLFGGLTVLFQLKKPVFSIAHACLAQLFFSLTVALSCWTSPAWGTAAPRAEPAGDPAPLHRVSLFLFMTLFVQLILGAVIRHTGHGVLSHMLLPAVVTVLVGLSTARVAGGAVGAPALARLLWALPAVLAVQIVLGALTYFLASGAMGLSRAAGTVVMTAHVAVGALLLGLSAAAALFDWRTRRADAGAGMGGLRDYVALSKPGVSLMTVLTTLVGYAMGAGGRFHGEVFLATAAGTLLLAASASALNMWRERDLDALMRRTESRPLPARRLSPRQALAFAALVFAAGMALLAGFVNGLTALVGAATLGVYVSIYTPMKTRSPWSTAVGAVAGALPPVMGWTAAQGRLGWEAAALFAILFFWQFPHFYALAWLYREDYARAGITMLPVVEPDGESTARKIVTHSFALMIASLLPAFFGMTGRAYPAAAFVLGLASAALAGLFFMSRSRAAARNVFLGSITYLPLLLSFLVGDRR